MKKLIFAFCIACFGVTFGQQQNMNNLYLFNHASINPAAIGSNNAVNVHLQYRNQWTGFDGAPKSVIADVSSPIGNTSSAVGLKLYQDENYFEKTNSVVAGYSYKVQTGIGNLVFGLNGGLLTKNYFWNKVDIKDKSDAMFVDRQTRVQTFTSDAGIYLYSKKYFVGLSATNLTDNAILLKKTSFGYDGNLSKHYFLMGGYSFDLSESLILHPSVMARKVANTPVSVDLNVAACYKNNYWIGTSIKLKYAQSFYFYLRVFDNLKLGYSLELAMNKIGINKNISHDLTLNYIIPHKNAQVNSFRYFN